MSNQISPRAIVRRQHADLIVGGLRYLMVPAACSRVRTVYANFGDRTICDSQHVIYELEIERYVRPKSMTLQGHLWPQNTAYVVKAPNVAHCTKDIFGVSKFAIGAGHGSKLEKWSKARVQVWSHQSHNIA